MALSLSRPSLCSEATDGSGSDGDRSGKSTPQERLQTVVAGEGPGRRGGRQRALGERCPLMLALERKHRGGLGWMWRRAPPLSW